jgi:hypothetical protein
MRCGSSINRNISEMTQARHMGSLCLHDKGWAVGRKLRRDHKISLVTENSAR